MKLHSPDGDRSARLCQVREEAALICLDQLKLAASSNEKPIRVAQTASKLTIALNRDVPIWIVEDEDEGDAA